MNELHLLQLKVHQYEIELELYRNGKATWADQFGYEHVTDVIEELKNLQEIRFIYLRCLNKLSTLSPEGGTLEEKLNTLIHKLEEISLSLGG